MSAEDNAPEQAREVEVVADILLDDVGLALADRSRNLAGAQATVKAIATSERVLAALAPVRAAERQEAARAAWGEGYEAARRDMGNGISQRGEPFHDNPYRADGVTGRSGT